MARSVGGVGRSVWVRLDRESWEVLEALATASGLGLAGVVSTLIEQWLDTHLDPEGLDEPPSES